VSLTANERRLRAWLAAQTKWSRANGVDGTAKARATFFASFLDEVDPERELPKAERLRRAESARSAYFTRLAFLSARARRQRKNVKNAGSGSRRASRNGDVTADDSEA
jgi:hypothetical protein